MRGGIIFPFLAEHDLNEAHAGFCVEHAGRFVEREVAVEASREHAAVFVEGGVSVRALEPARERAL